MNKLAITLALVACTTPRLAAENGARAGQFVVEPPTLVCLGFEWEIAGDDNRNATVELSYRRPGESGPALSNAEGWHEAMPLLRMGGEKIFRAPYTVPNKFAGSILDPQGLTVGHAPLSLRQHGSLLELLDVIAEDGDAVLQHLSERLHPHVARDEPVGAGCIRRARDALEGHRVETAVGLVGLRGEPDRAADQRAVR